jgi:hypothetical protein
MFGIGKFKFALNRINEFMEGLIADNVELQKGNQTLNKSVERLERKIAKNTKAMDQVLKLHEESFTIPRADGSAKSNSLHEDSFMIDSADDGSAKSSGFQPAEIHNYSTVEAKHFDFDAELEANKEPTQEQMQFNDVGHPIVDVGHTFNHPLIKKILRLNVFSKELAEKVSLEFSTNRRNFEKLMPDYVKSIEIMNQRGRWNYISFSKVGISDSAIRTNTYLFSSMTEDVVEKKIRLMQEFALIMEQYINSPLPRYSLQEISEVLGVDKAAVYRLIYCLFYINEFFLEETAELKDAV